MDMGETAERDTLYLRKEKKASGDILYRYFILVLHFGDKYVMMTYEGKKAR